MARERLQVGQRTTALDLAQVLDQNEGTFICQQGGQSFLATARQGHSITALRPVGQRAVTITTSLGGQEPWIVEKISDSEISLEDYRERERSSAGQQNR